MQLFRKKNFTKFFLSIFRGRGCCSPIFFNYAKIMMTLFEISKHFVPDDQNTQKIINGLGSPLCPSIPFTYVSTFRVKYSIASSLPASTSIYFKNEIILEQIVILHKKIYIPDVYFLRMEFIFLLIKWIHY